MWLLGLSSCAWPLPWPVCTCKLVNGSVLRVCSCVCLHTCVSSVHVNTHLYKCPYIYEDVFGCVCMYVNVCAHACILCAYEQVCVHAHVHVYTQVLVCVRMNAKLSVCLCMCAHMYVQAYSWFISLYPECTPNAPLLHPPLKLLPELGKSWQWEIKQPGC